MKALPLPVAIRNTTQQSKWETAVRRTLRSADISIGGTRPGDIQVHDDRFFRRVLKHGSLGLGESYVDGWWEAAQLDEFFAKLLGAGADKTSRPSSSWMNRSWATLQRPWNRQTRSRSRQNAAFHYDIGNDLYRVMLDRRMVYTCAYWKNAQDLDSAQEDKLERVCAKLQLESGMRVLDIGCGWGSFAAFAAERYGVQVTGVTVSEDQAQLGRERCAGLPVSILFRDYRDVSGAFDRVVSLGMFEHVGYKNYRTFMENVRDRLSPDGVFLLQTIGGNASVRSLDPWLDRYIFPNAMLPSVSQIGAAAENVFIMQDWENFGADYDRTLQAWFENFHRSWKALKSRYSERFYRTWKYYLLSCAGSFRCRRNQLWQVIFTPEGGGPGSGWSRCQGRRNAASGPRPLTPRTPTGSVT